MSVKMAASRVLFGGYLNILVQYLYYTEVGNVDKNLCILLRYEFGLNYILYCGSDSSSGKALRYGLEGPDSIPGVKGVEIFLHSSVSGMVLGSIQPPVK